MDDSSREVTPRHVLYALVGAGLLAAMAPLVFASGLVVPAWGTGVLVAVWLVAVTMAVRSWRIQMFGPVMWGVLFAVFWVAFVAGGGALFGWNP